MSRGMVDETEDWLPIGGLEPGFGENKPLRTEALVGGELEFLFDVDRSLVRYVFRDAGILSWEALEGPEQGAFEKVVEEVPLGRVARPDEIAGACVYLASDDSPELST